MFPSPSWYSSGLPLLMTCSWDEGMMFLTEFIQNVAKSAERRVINTSECVFTELNALFFLSYHLAPAKYLHCVKWIPTNRKCLPSWIENVYISTIKKRNTVECVHQCYSALLQVVKMFKNDFILNGSLRLGNVFRLISTLRLDVLRVKSAHV